MRIICLLFVISFCGWFSSVFSANIEGLTTNTILSQEEFDDLKKAKRSEIWQSEEIDMMTRYGYMRDGMASGNLRALIDKAWPEFYATYKDPSGRDWTLRERQRYDLEGNIVNF